MTRFGKYTSLIYLLLFTAILEFIGLTSLLLLGNETGVRASATWEEEVSDPADGNEIPTWLEPAPERIEEKRKPEGERTGPEILSQHKIIAHGLGITDGVSVLNCREGFEAMYAKGVRIFEADIRLTSDQRAVLRHDWRAGWQKGVSEGSVPTLDEFLSLPVLGKYTPLSFQDLLRLMEEHPDICIITDSKFSDAEIVRMQFDAMVQDAEELGLSYLLDRFVIQLYNDLMYEMVDNVHHFEGYIYTLYQEKFTGTADAFRETAERCTKNGISGITIEEKLWKPSYAAIAEEYGLAVYTHTVNGADRARELLESGVTGIYTDSLTPGDLDENSDNNDNT